jgi:hypothetical protein
MANTELNTIIENEPMLPEKPALLGKLKAAGFAVPDFIYIPAADFKNENFDALKRFFEHCCDLYKVIARSAHPQESFYKGGTFDSLETYSDVAGILYARKKMIKSVRTFKHLSIARQQKFNHAPPFDPDELGVVVMPFIEGTHVMAKTVGDHWEFGYTHTRPQKVRSDPYITRTPHDRLLLDLSRDIQNHLGFSCEIEYMVADDGKIWVVQAKDISHIEILNPTESEDAIQLDGIHRIRRRRNYRERPIFVMDNRTFYIDIIGMCEDIIHGTDQEPAPTVDSILEFIRGFEQSMEDFALRHHRFAVMGFSIQVDRDLFQVANHYLDEMPEVQKRLSGALRENIYTIDYFISEADTLIAKDKIRVNLGTHEAYGIDTIRNPMWSVFWRVDRHEQVVKRLREIGFKTGDVVGVEIDAEDKPTIHRI